MGRLKCQGGKLPILNMNAKLLGQLGCPLPVEISVDFGRTCVLVPKS